MRFDLDEQGGRGYQCKGSRHERGETCLVDGGDDGSFLEQDLEVLDAKIGHSGNVASVTSERDLEAQRIGTHPIDRTLPVCSNFSISFHVSTNVGDWPNGIVLPVSGSLPCGQCMSCVGGGGAVSAKGRGMERGRDVRRGRCTRFRGRPGTIQSPFSRIRGVRSCQLRSVRSSDQYDERNASRQLGRHENLLPRHATIPHGLAHRLLIPVSVGGIEVPVSELEAFKNHGIGLGVILRGRGLAHPAAHADGGDSVACVELECEHGERVASFYLIDRRCPAVSAIYTPGLVPTVMAENEDAPDYVTQARTEPNAEPSSPAADGVRLGSCGGVGVRFSPSRWRRNPSRCRTKNPSPRSSGNAPPVNRSRTMHAASTPCSAGCGTSTVSRCRVRG